MTKIAIFNYADISKNTGGPSGYLYNLIKGMNGLSKQIDIITIKKNHNIPNKNESTDKKIKNCIVEEFRLIAYVIKQGFLYKRKIDKKIYRYDVIHAHSCEDVFYLRKFIKYKGKIILTSHRPESLADEKISTIQIKGKTEWKFIILNKVMNYIESYGYKTSDAFIFPSEGAKNIYNKFPGFKKHSKYKPIEFLYTGTDQKNITKSRDVYRDEIGVCKNDKVLCYIGRHNYIKGYDILSSLSDRLEKEGVKVVCAGANNGLASPNNKNWIELGYISDPQNLINASDVVIIPNRNTYFDLVIVEVLSIGKVLITSNTGGNIDIANNTEGVMLFNAGDSEELYKVICDFLSNDEPLIERMQNENYNFYNENCNLSEFAKNYIKSVDYICNRIL